jgi:hypothetical protein
MSTTGLTVEEMIESLTGFEEIGIAKHFDMEWSDLAEAKPGMFLRSLVFTLHTREGKTAPEAKTQALTLTLKQVNDYFEDDDEVTPDEPDSDGVEQ